MSWMMSPSLTSYALAVAASMWTLSSSSASGSGRSLPTCRPGFARSMKTTRSVGGRPESTSIGDPGAQNRPMSSSWLTRLAEWLAGVSPSISTPAGDAARSTENSLSFSLMRLAPADGESSMRAMVAPVVSAVIPSASVLASPLLSKASTWAGWSPCGSTISIRSPGIRGTATIPPARSGWRSRPIQSCPRPGSRRRTIDDKFMFISKYAAGCTKRPKTDTRADRPASPPQNGFRPEPPSPKNSNHNINNAGRGEFPGNGIKMYQPGSQIATPVLISRIDCRTLCRKWGISGRSQASVSSPSTTTTIHQ